MPDPAVALRVFAEGGEARGDGADVGVAVRQVDVAERQYLAAGERAGEDGAAEGGVEDAGAGEVARAAEDDADPAGLVRGQVLLVQRGPHPALGAGGPPGRGLGHHLAVGLAVRVEGVEHDEPGVLGLGRAEDGLLDAGQEGGLEVVGDVDAVVDDGGAPDRLPGPLGGADVAPEAGDAGGGRAGAGTVDEADRVPPAGQFPGEGRAGGAGAEDDVRLGGGVVRGGGHGLVHLSWAGRTRADRLGGGLRTTGCELRANEPTSHHFSYSM